MVEYTKQVDWQINSAALQELVKRGVDVKRLQITSTRGILEIRGTLAFGAATIEDLDVMLVFNKLRIIDRTMRGIPYLRDIQWKLLNWKKVGQNWHPA